MKTAIVFHDDFRKYALGSDHPFTGERYKHLPEVFGHKDLSARKSEITFMRPKPADEACIEAVHGEQYLGFIRGINETGGMITLDTPIPPGLYDIARLFAGANILAGRLIAENMVRRVVVPGLGAHHAGYDFGGGFCMINDIAVMIEYLRKYYPVQKIMAIDYDAHCGDGTQDIYYDCPDVLCVDLHQDPMTLFPGKGFAYQIGVDAGQGHTINLPMPPGASDEDFMRAFQEVILPVAMDFAPDLIVANGGLDAHVDDPLSQLRLSINGFQQMMRSIADLSQKVCDSRLILILGGGYNPKVVPAAWTAMISAMLGGPKSNVTASTAPPAFDPAIGRQVGEMVQEVKRIQRPYWPCLCAPA
ncbi:conserved hypothetical protein [Desulfosarcina cetonica]|nr:conserved hypothetical protein [Desulfosarcina cetonica]